MNETLDYFISVFKMFDKKYDLDELLQIVEPYRRNKMKKKAIIFSRVSTFGQDLTQQTNVLLEEAHRSGYKDEDIITIEHHESAIKLDIEERLGIQELKRHIEEDNIECVFIYEISRLSRKSTMLYQVRDYLIEHGIQLICCKPYMRLLEDGKMSQTASILFSLFSTLSESEMMIKKERFMRAKDALKRQGKKSAGAVKFGYVKLPDKSVALHPTNSKIVADIFNHYMEPNVSQYETYMWLTSQYPELFPILPYKKAQHKVHNILVDETYLGNWCYPVLISDELFNNVKDKLSKSKQQARFTTKYTYLGRGILYCKHCGKMMTPVGGKTKAYNCPTDKLHNMTINVANIDKIIWDDVKVIANINASISNSEKVNETTKMIEQKNNIINGFDNELNNLNEQQAKLLNLYLSNKINESIFDAKNKEIEQSIDEIKTNINKLKAEIVELQNILKNNPVDIKPINYDNIEDDDVKIEIIRKYVNKIWVEKLENRTYLLEFEYKTCVVPQIGIYKYRSAGGHIQLTKINKDNTEDLIIKI